MKSILIFISVTIINSVLSDWDFNKHGEDWKDWDSSCDASKATIHIAPLKLSSTSASKPDAKTFFELIPSNKVDSMLTVDTDANLILTPKDQFNINSLKSDCNVNDNDCYNVKKAIKNNKDDESSSSYGTLTHNFYTDPDFEMYSSLKYNDNDNNSGVISDKRKLDDDVIRFYFKNIVCDSIYIRIPGGHTIDDKAFSMELQLLCTGLALYSGEAAKMPNKIVLLVEIEDEKESQLFKNIKTSDIKLNGEISIQGLNEIFNPFISTQGFYFYKGNRDYPKCYPERSWFIIERTLKISKEKYEAFKAIIYSNKKSTDGNSRTPNEPGTDNPVYYVNYSKKMS